MLPREKAFYRVRAVAAQIAPGDKGSQVSITGRVIDHPTYTNEEITVILHFSPAAMDRSVESLMHFDFQSDDLTLLQDATEARCAELLPGIAVFACKPDEWDGKPRLKVKWVNQDRAGGGFAFKQKLEGGERKAYGAEMKSIRKNARGPKKPATGGARPKQSHPNGPGRDEW